MKQLKFFFLFVLLLTFLGCSNNIDNSNLNTKTNSQNDLIVENIVKNTEQNVSNEVICFINQIVIVNGNSMSPLIKDGDELMYLKGYYDCNEVKRGDVVILNQSGNENFIIKQIVGIPKDTFEYKNKLIYINGIELKNSQNISYSIDSKMLRLYANSYPILPENTYLILGDNPYGTFDSSKFGLVSKQEIVGKVVK